MTILYAIVAKPGDPSKILAEYAQTTGNFKQVTATILAKINARDRKESLTYDANICYHLMCESGVLYMAMCDDQRPRVPFAFLDRIKTEFREAYTDADVNKAIAYSFDKAFGKKMAAAMEHFNNPGSDNFSNVENKINEVKNVMVQNIDSILARGEKLDMLVDRTQELQESSKQFRNQSRALRQAMLYRKIKMYALIFLAFSFFMWLLTSFICGFDYDKC